MARTKQPLLIGAALAAVLSASAARPAADFDDLQESAIKAAVRKVAPCVVQIETSGGTDVVVAGPRGLLRRGTGPTSGLAVGEDGYIVSSAFNFANKPSQIRVSVPGLKERRVAKVVATDQTRMLTLLKIDLNPGEKLPLPAPSPKKDFKVGQTAIAVGRTLAASAADMPSVSVGIISATDRIWGRAVQTDAKVSPANYGGPLVDLYGRVQGVLVPASPRAEGELAGFEWYDSGIGFAVPLEDVLRVLPRLKAGKDLRHGVLGITMQGDEFTTAPTIATVAPGSPAEKAGVKPGDVVKAIDGKEVHNQAQLRHQLGPKYEGDTVAVTLQRGKDEVKIDKVALTAAAAGTGQPFLGILPVRDDPGPGVEVRYVYPGSPADKAGVKAGDRVTKLGRTVAPGRVVMQPVVARDALLALMDVAQPGVEIKVEVTRKAGGKTETLTATLAVAPDVVPDKLPERASAKLAKVKPGTKPPAAPKKDDKKDDKDEKKFPTGFQKRTTAASDHTYWIYVPENYDPNIAHSVVIWLHPTGKNKEKDFDDLTWSWQEFCEDNHVIVICPSCDAASGWTPGESEFIAETVRTVGNTYTLDRRRVVAHGMGLGGEMAYYLGFHSRNLIRGVATVGAPMTSNPKERVANQPLAFFLVAGDKDPLKGPIKDTAAKLREHKYPEMHREVPDLGHQYIDGRAGTDVLKELARWVDSLDRM
jgi:S1-C subfamily serine protease